MKLCCKRFLTEPRKMHSYKIVISHLYKCTKYLKFPLHFPCCHILSLDESLDKMKREKKYRMNEKTNKLKKKERTTRAILLPLLVDLFVCFLLLSHRALHICSFPSFQPKTFSLLAILRFILLVSLCAFAIKSNHFNIE